jgi:RNA polymerase sigma-70 factor (ECF subfamily)
VPEHPRAWLVSTGRFKAIAGVRHQARFDASQEKIAEQLEAGLSEIKGRDDEGVEGVEGD